ncbi:hypothetical protein Bca4012_007183 [Brassica carinata]|uniref:Methyltransferase type 11 domain-containing protein n=1 Tax=Brassica napus TaxID=3708 RepID=A0ABQ7X1M5_BRANA|nr:hypothetical protein HID58_090438 [Brassica napus]
MISLSLRNSVAQARLSERALKLLALPEDDVPRFLLDIGCGFGLSGETISENGHQWIGLDISASLLNVAVEREVEGDLLLGDMGQVCMSITRNADEKDCCFMQ